jgi:hypothetical protein
MSDNPYSVPDSNLADEDREFDYHDPIGTPIGYGAKWYADGFRYFTRNAGIWIAICLVGFLLLIAVSFVPFGNVLTPVFFGGLMIGCKAIYDGNRLELSHLFAGFQGDKIVPLILCGLVQAGAMLVIMIICLIVAFVPVFSDSMRYMFDSDYGLGLWFLLVACLFMALYLPVIMATWFVPMLCALNKVPLMEAMRLSFSACLRNFMPYLLYGFIGLLLFIPVVLTFGLGMLVMIPVFYGSVFASYTDIFIEGYEV